MLQKVSFAKIHLWFGQKRMSSLVQSKAYVNGSWVDAFSCESYDVKNPANGDVIGRVPNMFQNDVHVAICAAKKAFHSEEWSKLTGKARSYLLRAWFNLIEKNKNAIAKIMTAESGKPTADALGEVTYGNSFLEWFSEEARRIYGEIVPETVPNQKIMVMKEPIGVVGLITPWNFPLAMITRKAGAALAAGCTVIIKPSSETPLTALAMAKLAEKVGFPKGVINIITNNKPSVISDVLCTSPHVAGISFTGSTDVGKLLYKNCSQGIKRICLELGGNAPFIVFNSANVEKAVEGAMVSKFRNCGQTCVASNRFFIQQGIYDEFLKLLVEKVTALNMGPGDQPGVQIGPLISKAAIKKVSSLVKDAVEKNATIVTGGVRCKNIGKLFYAPTILTDIRPSMKLYQEEVFGPVIGIIKFRYEEEAIEQANNTQVGLAGYFYSENYQQIFRVASKLEVGLVGVNAGLISTAEAPFGGVKQSGIGREGSHHGLEDYLNIKYICIANLKQ